MNQTASKADKFTALPLQKRFEKYLQLMLIQDIMNSIKYYIVGWAFQLLWKRSGN